MTKNGFIAIVGRANAGKSSLLNRLLGEKIAIVSDKPQTTRNRITGVLTQGETQYVFIDTPGMHKPKSKLGKFMVRQAGQSVADVDAVVMMVEWGKKPNEIEEELCRAIKNSGAPAILAINKIDTLKDKEKLLTVIESMSKLHSFDAVVPISATQGDGLDRLFEELDKHCVEGPHFFEDDTLTDQPERAIVAEIIREKLLHNLRDEIPHGTAVVIEKMREREEGGLIDIDATIICERESHKGMIIGKRGAMLKTIATAARTDCERFLDCKINLQCWVKIREGWRDSDILLKNFGFRED